MNGLHFYVCFDLLSGVKYIRMRAYTLLNTYIKSTPNKNNDSKINMINVFKVYKSYVEKLHVSSCVA